MGFANQVAGGWAGVRVGIAKLAGRCAREHARRAAAEMQQPTLIAIASALVLQTKLQVGRWDDCASS
eukprot:3477058-Pyramimonas_sp.AAC.1